MKEDLFVNTIYSAFMGEVNAFGIGHPCVFVRLSGCNLRCYSSRGITCDTPEALNVGGKAMSVDEILLELQKYKSSLICLTGGEPLMQYPLRLLEELSKNNYNVVVETNGSKSILPYKHIRNVSFVVDVKSLSSGESEKMLEENYLVMDSNDYVKFVIDTERDYIQFLNWRISHGYMECQQAVGLCWGSKFSYGELFNRLQKDNVNVYMNIQAHKLQRLYDSADNKEIAKLLIPKNI